MGQQKRTDPQDEKKSKKKDKKQEQQATPRVSIDRHFRTEQNKKKRMERAAREQANNRARTAQLVVEGRQRGSKRARTREAMRVVEGE